MSGKKGREREANTRKQTNARKKTRFKCDAKNQTQTQMPLLVRLLVEKRGTNIKEGIKTKKRFYHWSREYNQSLSSTASTKRRICHQMSTFYSASNPFKALCAILLTLINVVINNTLALGSIPIGLKATHFSEFRAFDAIKFVFSADFFALWKSIFQLVVQK